MKIDSVRANNRRGAFEVAFDERVLPMPYVRLDVQPSADDPLASLYVDDELGSEGFTYVLKSGAEASVHLDHVLDYNEDPEHMRELLLYKLTLDAQRCVKESGLSKREIIRKLGTSPAQLYRLLDTANTKKSVDKLLLLFAALDCEVDISVTAPVR